MYHSHFLSRNPEKIKTYKKYANTLVHIKNKSKTEYYNNQFVRYKDNLRSTWKVIGSIIKRKTKGQSLPTKLVYENKTYTNEADIADIFNTYFTSVGPTLASRIRSNSSTKDPTHYISKSPCHSFILSPVAESQVLNLFTNLDESKAYLNIPNKFIKIASHQLTVPFTKIYNESITTGAIPEIFKISRITPIFKSGDTTEPGNYRPIAIISVFSKVLEKLVYNQLINFIEKHNILYNYQFGFRKGYSTEYAILETVENLKTAIDENKITCGIFLDFSKAFDTINHQILLAKLFKYGIRGLPHTWFTSYLSNRQQYVKVGEYESDLRDITCGVPQGSTLGPLLFLLYINDLPNSSQKLLFRIFADDTNIFYSSKDLNELETVVNNELVYVLEYCAVNKLSINFKKTNYMLITSPRKNPSISITTCDIECTKQIKYLGVFIDNHLKWEPHIKHINNELTKNIGILN